MKRFGLLALVAALCACSRERVQPVDAVPELPSSIEFGLVPVNRSVPLPVTVQNLGQISLTVTDTQVAEPFDVDSSPDPVGPGGAAQLVVKFTPVEPGEVNGTLTVMTSSTQLPAFDIALHGVAFVPRFDFSPDRLDFGDVQVGEQKTLQFQLTNVSPLPLNPDIEGTGDGSDFVISPLGPLGAMDTSSTSVLTVTFAPARPGPQDSAVVVSCPVCATKQVLLSGTGVGDLAPPPPPPPPPPDAGVPDAGGSAPDAGDGTPDAGTPDAGDGTPDAGPPPEYTCVLSASPSNVDFGTLRPGDSARQVVTLSSSGSGPCFVQTPYVAPGTDPSFQPAGVQPLTLQPGASSPFTVTWTPGASTPSQVSGGIVVFSNDKVSSPLLVPLSGVVQKPPPPPPPPAPGLLIVAPPRLAFTAQAPNAPPSQTASVSNVGQSPLTWSASVNDPSVTFTPASGTLQPGASASIALRVAGQGTAGSRTSALSVDAGTAGQGAVALDISFTAAPPPPPPPALLDVQPLSLAFHAQLPAAPPAQTLTVSNLGGQPLSWTGNVDDAGVHFTPGAGSLAPGAAQLVRVSVDAAPFAGSRNATLTVDAAAAGSKQVAISIDVTAPPAPPPPPPQYGGSAWPKWHHDNASSGLSHVDTSANTGAVRWKARVGPPVPCINDGRTNWNTRCGTYVSSPVLDEQGNVVQLGGDGKLHLFDRATGKEKWSVDTAPPWIAANEGTPTVVKDGSIFLMTAGESFTRPQFYKVSGAGKLLWNNQPGGDCGGRRCDGYDSSPALGDDGTLYEANDDYGRIDYYDQRGVLTGSVPLDPRSDVETQSAALSRDNVGYWAANGHLWAVTQSRQLWSFTDSIAANQPDWEPPAAFHNIKSSPALTPDGKVLFTYVFETASKGVTRQTTRIYAFQAGVTKKLLWMTTLGPTTPRPGLTPGGGLAPDYADALHYRSGLTSPAVGPDGTLYVGHCDGLFALDPATGKFKWGVGMGEVVSSPAVGADGTVYVGSSDGNLYAIAPGAKAGTIKWQVKTGGQLNSSPAIGPDGTVYVTSDDGYVYAVH